jgi:uncharacterized protein
MMSVSTNFPPEYWFVVVTGVSDSGKTSFIKSIGDSVFYDDESFLTHVEKIGFNPLSLDITQIISDDGSILYLLATRNTRLFDFMWEIAATGRILGYVVMVDSAKPAAFHEAKGILELFRAYYSQPGVVAANFQDQPDAWDAESLHILFQLPDDIPIVPCVATDPASVKTVLLTLLDQVIKDIDEAEEQEIAL